MASMFCKLCSSMYNISDKNLICPTCKWTKEIGDDSVVSMKKHDPTALAQNNAMMHSYSHMPYEIITDFKCPDCTNKCLVTKSVHPLHYVCLRCKAEYEVVY